MVKPFILSGVDSKAACDLDAAYNCLAQEEMSVSRKLVASPHSVWPIVHIQCMAYRPLQCMTYTGHQGEPRHQVAEVWHLSGW